MSITGNNIEKLVATLATPFQSLENALQQLLTERSVDTAVGAQLDVIGKLVGQPRNGLVDADYRRYVRARVATNRSTGVVDDLINITELIVYDDDAYIKVESQSIATVVLRVEDLAITTGVANILIDFLNDAVSAGVRVILEYSDQAPATWFKWDTAGRGWDNGKFIDAKDNNGTEGS